MIKRRKILIYTLLFLLLLIIFILMQDKLKGLTTLFIEIDKLRDYILSFGIWSPVVFFIIQTMQVIIAPIPGNITGAVSGGIFGIYFGFFLSGTALVLGSCLAFILAKKFGKPLVRRFVKDETLEKYHNFNSRHMGKGLFILFLIPFIPDDILCFIVGLTDITFKRFIFTLILGRLPGTFISVLMGAGILERDNNMITIAMVFYVAIILLALKYSTKFKQFIE